MASGMDLDPDHTTDRSANITTEDINSCNNNILLWAMIDVCLCIVILTGNILTIISISVSRKLSSQVSNLFILSLATSDLLVGLVIPYHMAFYLKPELGQDATKCLIRLGLVSLACIASLCNIITIALDRYIAIVHPLKYNKILTKRNARILSFLAWIIAIIIATTPLYWNQMDGDDRCELSYVLSPFYIVAILVPAFVTMYVLMCFVYFKIVREANKHIRRLKKNNQCTKDSAVGWKSVQVLMLVMGCFTLSYTPYLLTVMINTVFGHRNTSTLYKITNSLAMANSAINPLIYAWKNKDIKQVYSRFLHCESINSNSINDSSVKDEKSNGKKNDKRPISLHLSNNELKREQSESVRSFSLTTIQL